MFGSLLPTLQSLDLGRAGFASAAGDSKVGPGERLLADQTAPADATSFFVFVVLFFFVIAIVVGIQDARARYCRGVCRGGGAP